MWVVVVVRAQTVGRVTVKCVGLWKQRQNLRDRQVYEDNQADRE